MEKTKPKMNNISNKFSFDGTYNFCNGCPSNGNCCSRVKLDGEIDAPVLFPSDLKLIKEFTLKEENEFSMVRNESQFSLRTIKTGEKGCYFYKDGKCSIYPVRPLDCRLFPLDIIENPEGKIMWIAYQRLCPVNFDPKEYLEKAKKILPELGENVYQYAALDLPGMDKEPYIELEELNL